MSGLHYRVVAHVVKGEMTFSLDLAQKRLERPILKHYAKVHIETPDSLYLSSPTVVHRQPLLRHHYQNAQRFRLH